MVNGKVISGKLRIKLNAKTVYHATECNLTMSRELKERNTKDTNGIQRAKGVKSWSASTSSLAVYGGDGSSSHDFFALFDLYNDDTDATIAVEFVPSEGDATFKLSGQGLIESLEMNAANDEDATASISISGFNAMEKVAII
jgi:hypothetical protein